ncbi:MAG: hypothetical protein R3C56_34570 [Pirellulaceae bacterium]
MDWIPDSSDLAVLTHTGHLWRLDCQGAMLSPLAAPLSGRITSLLWKNDHELWLGVKPNRVVQFNLASSQVVADHSPRATTLENVYRWLIKPFYIINPKPAALDTAMSYALTGNKRNR